MAITKITTPELFDFSATNTALQLPTGDTASRPTNASAGEWRFNSELKYVEYYDGTTPYDAAKWFQIDTEAIANSDEFPSENFNVNTYSGTQAAQTIDAKFNEAANFNGTTSRITSAPISGLSNASVSLWLKSSNSSSSESRGIIELNGDTSSNGYAGTLSVLYTYSSGAILVRSGNASSSETDLLTHTDTTLRDGNWNNLVVTRDESSGDTTLYINGSQADQETVASTSTVGGGTFIGDRATGSAGNYNWDGAIDQVRIFNTALSPAQAEDCYTDETTTTAATLNFPAGAGCIAAYQLDGDASDLSGTYGGVETSIGYTGLKFTPDLVWIKSRNEVNLNVLTDSIRGTDKQLFSNQSDAESTSTNRVTSFNNNGFSIASGSPLYRINKNSVNYASWCFKAGGAPDATNSNGAGLAPILGSVMIDGVKSTAALAGTIAATKISANTAAGFTIIEYTGNGTNNSTVAHGLSQAPELWIGKRFDPSGGASPWQILFSGLPEGTFFQFDNSAKGFSSNVSFDPTTTTIKLQGGQNINNTGGINIGYGFHSVANYQKIGTYTGTNAPGTIISTEINSGDGGFEPAFLMIKSTGATSGNWIVLDNKRNPVNPRTDVLKWDTDGIETTEAALDVTFTTNGFVLNGAAGSAGTGQINDSGIDYIFLAIAADKDTSVPTVTNSFSIVKNDNPSTNQNISAGLKPDFVWIKSYSNITSWGQYDTVRGSGEAIQSDNTDAENNYATHPSGNLAMEFTAGGYTTPPVVNDNINNSGYDYINYFWKVGGLPTLNTDGNITSIVSANQAAGISIVEYTTLGSKTIGHGLLQAPELIIQKRLDVTSEWVTYTATTGLQNYLQLQDTAIVTPDANFMTAVGTTTFTSQWSSNNHNYINYCFHSVAGYVDVGSYAGVSTGTNTHVTGFEPSFVMIKGTNFADSWYIYDNQRRTPPSSILFADSSEVEYTTDNSALYVTFVSGGVGVGGFTTSGALSGIDGATRNFIYLAIK